MSSMLKLNTFISLTMLTLPVAVTANESPWPVGVVDQAESQTQQTITIPVIANDIGNSLEITEVNTTTVGLGSASISSDKKSVVYQSASEFFGTDSFWYAFKDDQGRTNAAKVTVNVSTAQTRPPEWPSAAYESPEIAFNQTTELNVLDNDQGVGLRITQVNTTSIKLGSVSISADGKSLIYTPPQGFSGNDEFWYVFSDSWGRTNAGKVTPIVKPGTDYSAWPTATPDYADTVSTRSVLIPVLNNDIGGDLSLNTVNTTTVGLGSARIEGDYIRYVPAASYSGQDSFWYSFVDKQGRANSTQVFVNVTQNTQLSSIAFCGVNYFTDGTPENTTTSGNPVDSSAVELNTSPDVAQFTSPSGAFAVVNDRRYYLEASGGKKHLMVEKNGQSSTVRTFSATETVYGIGIRDSKLYLAYIPDEQYEYVPGGSTTARQHTLLSHDGESMHDLGTYLLLTSTPIEMMATQGSTLVRYIGRQNIGDGPEVISNRGETPYQYLEIIPEDNKAIFLAKHANLAWRSGRVSNVEQLELLHYDQHLITSTRNVITGTYPATTYQLHPISRSLYPDGRLEKAVLSNNRLLLTTTPHTNDINWVTPNPEFPAKLFSFDSFTGWFTELASCE